MLSFRFSLIKWLKCVVDNSSYLGVFKLAKIWDWSNIYLTYKQKKNENFSFLYMFKEESRHSNTISGRRVIFQVLKQEKVVRCQICKMRWWGQVRADVLSWWKSRFVIKNWRAITFKFFIQIFRLSSSKEKSHHIQHSIFDFTAPFPFQE